MEYKLGKAKPRIDSRTIPAKALFRAGALPPAPVSFDVDRGLQAVIGNPMYANNKYGDCVIAARAHMTRRFEYFEQCRVLPINDTDVVEEYWREQGYIPSNCWLKRFFQSAVVPDGGLVMLNSLSAWRKEGWKAAGQKYDIYAYAALDWFDLEEVKAGIFYLNGAYIGINLPPSAQRPCDIWQYNSEPGTGRHCVYVKAYDENGLTCITWGVEQRMTWDFWKRYVDEAYLVVDNRNRFTENSPVDVDKLSKILQEVTQ
jgi:hypothetical protein